VKTCAILVPILGRPGNVAALVASHAASEQSSRLVFICNHDDEPTLAAVRAAMRDAPSREVALVVVPWEGGAYADWARKLNWTWPLVKEEWRLHGADDIHFHPGWLDEALRVAARFDVCVVGTNDLGNPRVVAGVHATHQLVHRDYWECGTVDEAGKVVTEVYHHNFVDDEFVQTAIARGTYASARSSIIEHFHPDWGKAEDDETYRKGKSQFGRDTTLFNARRHLWEGSGRRGTVLVG
jgi:hypothetical protein